MKYCFAYCKICYLCRNQNHFKGKCTSQRRQVYEIKPDNANNDNDDVFLSAVHIKHSDTHTTFLEVNECKVRFQIYTDAQVNNIYQHYVRREQVPDKNKFNNVE